MSFHLLIYLIFKLREMQYSYYIVSKVFIMFLVRASIDNNFAESIVDQRLGAVTIANLDITCREVFKVAVTATIRELYTSVIKTLEIGYDALVRLRALS